VAEPLVQHVSDTAFLIAHHRAIESARPDALFHDPLAARLAGEKGRSISEALPTAGMTGWMVSMRTVIIDDFIRDAIARGIDTVVNLGAGLDTRPYRLELPAALSWIEVDYPDVIAFKEARIGADRPRCKLERIGLDLADLPSRRSLFRRLDGEAGRLLVLTEGVVPYLDVDQAASLADDLRALTRVDGWIVDYVSPESHAYRRRSGTERFLRQTPFKFRPPDWFAFFAQHGWRPRQMRYLADEGQRLRRRPPLPLRIRVLMAVTRPLTPAARRGAFRKSAAYAVLEPTAAVSASPAR
jgi:methyltransferase (TIGR00027 family)